MKKFIFRLETLLRIRKAREGTLKRDLEYAHQKWLQSKSHEVTLQTQIGTLMDEMQKRRLEGNFDLQDTYSQILDHLSAALFAAQQNLSAEQKRLEVQQACLKLAIQQRKIIEKIKEKHYSDWRTSEIQTEEALLDEIGCHKQAHLG